MTEAARPARGAGRDIGLYVHWPYCARICPYCDFNVVRHRGRGDEAAALVAAILADLRAQAAGARRRRLVSIFFGGGTPSLMDAAAVSAIVESARGLFTTTPDLEVTLEANPTDAEADRFAAFAAAGVTRLSLGVQSLHDADLAFLGRNHDAAAARRAASVAARVFPRLSIDLIYALPGQTLADWRERLEAALSLGAEHVSAYQLTCEPGTAFERAVRRGEWAPSAADTAAALFETTQEMLGEAGLEPYEVSNHARGSGAQSRHNLIYWRGADYLGVGPGAHGRLTDDVGTRRARLTAKKVADYIAQVEATGAGLIEDEPLSAAEAALERLLMGLRTLEGVALGELAPLAIDRQEIGSLIGVGLLQQSDGRLVATRRGRVVLDRITLDLARSARQG